MKATYDFFNDIALIYLNETMSVNEANSLLLLVTKLGSVGIKQVIIDISKTQPDSQASQVLLNAKPKLRNSKTPQGLFVGKPDDGVADFATITDAIDRFPSGEGLKVKEVILLQNELESLKSNLKNVEGVLKMSGSIEQKQKAIQQKNNYLNRINANLDSELKWLATEIKFMRDMTPSMPADAIAAGAAKEAFKELDAQIIAFFDSVVSAASNSGDQNGTKKPS